MTSNIYIFLIAYKFLKNEYRKVFSFTKSHSLITERRPNIDFCFFNFYCTVENNFFKNVLFQ
jgi:hypothetical protein